METTIPKKTKAPHQIEKIEKIIYNPRIVIKKSTHIDLLSISEEEEFTRIDFIKYQSNAHKIQSIDICLI